ncbi:hypothetical protein [Halopelagius fulvigenes]|uniref:Uncharacterized protein n=1 Tax=Halopelagius fulvigenes TaxID=1198324 RepID=A0ABD5TXT2_9EURY
MSSDTETVEGFVIDIACVRKNPREGLPEDARTHTKECALEGHCVESGYAVVTDEDRLVLLDSDATTQVVETIERSETERGHRVRVKRERTDGGTMETTAVEEL